MGTPAAVNWSSPTVHDAAAAIVHTNYAVRLHAAESSPALQSELVGQVGQAVLDRELIVYLLAGAIIAVLGAVARALVHSSKIGLADSLDYTGKCLALVGTIVVAVAAYDRFFNGELSDRLPDLAVGLYWSGVIILTVVLFALGFWSFVLMKSKRKSG